MIRKKSWIVIDFIDGFKLFHFVTFIIFCQQLIDLFDCYLEFIIVVTYDSCMTVFL